MQIKSHNDLSLITPKTRDIHVHIYEGEPFPSYVYDLLYHRDLKLRSLTFSPTNTPPTTPTRPYKPYNFFEQLVRPSYRVFMVNIHNLTINRFKNPSTHEHLLKIFIKTKVHINNLKFLFDDNYHHNTYEPTKIFYTMPKLKINELHLRNIKHSSQVSSILHYIDTFLYLNISHTSLPLNDILPHKYLQHLTVLTITHQPFSYFQHHVLPHINSQTFPQLVTIYLVVPEHLFSYEKDVPQYMNTYQVLSSKMPQLKMFILAAPYLTLSGYNDEHDIIIANIDKHHIEPAKYVLDSYIFDSNVKLATKICDNTHYKHVLRNTH